MLQAGFKLETAANKRPPTNALVRTATGIDTCDYILGYSSLKFF
jgi:hypothetical protein